ncbi:MAG: phosphatidylserine decarboxylase family protein [Bacteroidales bacterium]|nr:phosphatidylserine decarboxylase family protein [Bacteroidales bacterium]
MRIHKEGYKTLIIVFLILTILSVFVFFCDCNLIFYISIFLSSVLFSIVLQFFRKPKRIIKLSTKNILSPADGKVVVIEKTKETEYFKDERIKVSVFMSLWNVHINFYPVAGIIKYAKYHKGKYLLAINPKSSEENERTTIVVENEEKKEILFRQIAGTVARRIVYYAKKDDKVKQAQECGFIKFGSRLDIFIPLDADIKVKIGDKVKGTQSVIAEI